MISELLFLIWWVISSIIKVVVYFAYFIPFVGFKILQFLNLWPYVWPLN
jgi:hypothetical protein